MAASARPEGTKRVDLNLPEDLYEKLLTARRYSHEDREARRGELTDAIIDACRLYVNPGECHRIPDWLKATYDKVRRLEWEKGNAGAFTVLGEKVLAIVKEYAPRG